MLGSRRKAEARRSPVPRSDGKGLRITGWVLLVIGVLGVLASGVDTTT